MKIITWIQNSDEFLEDFLFEDDKLLDSTNPEKRQQLIVEMLNIKKSGKLLADEEYLKIYKDFKKDKSYIDLKAENLDKHNRKVAVMVMVENYNENDDSENFDKIINNNFRHTETIISNYYYEKVKDNIIKKKTIKF